MIIAAVETPEDTDINLDRLDDQDDQDDQDDSNKLQTLLYCFDGFKISLINLK
jgi:hypothetical protein